MSAGEVRLRAAIHGDAVLVHRWANDPDTRAASFSTASIPLAEHLAWFERELARDDHHLYMAELDDEPIGFVRLDARTDSPGSCTISINMAPAARGRGLGVASLVAATETARRLNMWAIHALVRPDNHASVRAFERAGYVLANTTTVADATARLYLLRLD